MQPIIYTFVFCLVFAMLEEEPISLRAIIDSARSRRSNTYAGTLNNSADTSADNSSEPPSLDNSADNSLDTSSEPPSLDTSLNVQLEAKMYYVDGISIEDENIFIVGA